MSPDIAKLSTRAESLIIQWELSGDPVKAAGSQGTSPEFQIQWDCGGGQDLKHPQIILMDVVWKHTLLHASLYHNASFANLQKSPMLKILFQVLCMDTRTGQTQAQNQGSKSQNGPKQLQLLGEFSLLVVSFCLSSSTQMIACSPLFQKKRQ